MVVTLVATGLLPPKREKQVAYIDPYAFRAPVQATSCEECMELHIKYLEGRYVGEREALPEQLSAGEAWEWLRLQRKER